ncbi:MAG: NAD-dependent epimerase/dehydratase family protein [Hyphomicrobiales bacterium]|nr:NAD-dependent epimerase/dehydratase family protein [Hyphomicrobiales bacterium]
MTILVTGAAGFIGFHISKALLDRGERVTGIDNLNAYYDPELKNARIELLRPYENFSFLKRDIADETVVDELAAGEHNIHTIIHMAAQAGVRHSLDDPFSYARSNLQGQVVICELARRIRQNNTLRHFVFASSSSVYGGNDRLPFSVKDPLEKPLSLYAASKHSGEIIARAYVHLFSIPATALRFFTVYGPWGRPDMALFKFTKSILEDKPITLFNYGDMERDFTYIDDIVDGVLAATQTAPPHGELGVYNLGNHKMESLRALVTTLERALGKGADKRLAPLQPGDAPRTYADISESVRDLNFQPKTSIAQGIPRFVEWYREYYGV